jgi:hypothetical protein
MKWVALHTTLPWPQGVPTRPEVDPRRAGTPPGEFTRDKAETLRYLRRFVEPDAPYDRHPAFGAMSREEWLLWGFAHMDHHLRQFGL